MMKSKRPFTLIELLVVVVIIAILAALLLPALAKAKYRARLVVCKGQLKEIALGVSLYAEDYESEYPATFAMGEGGVATLGFRGPTYTDNGWQYAGFSGPSYKELVNYLGGLKPGLPDHWSDDWLNHKTNKLMECPEGVNLPLETAPDNTYSAQDVPGYYSFHFDSGTGTGGFSNASVSGYSNQLPNNPTHIMRKVGTPKILSGLFQHDKSRGYFPTNAAPNKYPRFHILASDIVNRHESYMGTNHTWGADAFVRWFNYNTGIRMNVYGGTSTANFAFDDGHVESWTFRTRDVCPGNTKTSYTSSNNGQPGDAFAYPMEFAEF